LTPGRFAPDETDSAVEKLLLKKNGSRTTITDIKELLLAVSHDSRNRDALVLARLDAHLSDKVHLDEDEFAKLLEGFARKHADRDTVVSDIKAEVDAIKENCLELHARAPRRATDPETEDWGNSFGEKTRREVWLMWLLSTAVGKVLLVVAGGAAMIGIERLFGS
jgi:hypothetical protein